MLLYSLLEANLLRQVDRGCKSPLWLRPLHLEYYKKLDCNKLINWRA